MAGELIHIIEDEREIAELIRDYLEDEGFNVVISTDGQKGYEAVLDVPPQLVILDLMLPNLDGFEVCRNLRKTLDIPVIIVSSKTSDIDKVLALGIGADDYVTKPFSTVELIARVKAHLRRARHASVHQIDNYIYFGDIRLDVDGYNVYRGEELIPLTNKEFELLKMLATNPRRVLTKDQIIEEVWGNNFYGDENTVPVHIRKLREKIEIDSSNPIYIQTVWGIGYRFTGGKKLE